MLTFPVEKEAPPSRLIAQDAKMLVVQIKQMSSHPPPFGMRHEKPRLGRVLRL